jgi:hypothetical protein
MKAISIFILCWQFCLVCDAQVPQRIHFQTVLRSTNNVLLTNAAVSLRLSIVHDNPEGEVVYSETHSASTNANGWVGVDLGAGINQTGSFAAINWASGLWYVQLEADFSGGSAFNFISTQQLLSVPYAFHAQTAHRLSVAYPETDPVFLNSLAAGITAADTAAWNAKQAALIAGDGIEIDGDTIRLSRHYIGELFGGGMVVSVWEENGVQHGLIAALTDAATSVWSNISIDIVGLSAQSKVDGEGNTQAVLQQPGHTTSAALACANYTHDGFSDWYLPALWELEQWSRVVFLMQQQNGENLFGQVFWSSTELPDLPAPGFINSNAYLLGLGYGEWSPSAKNNSFRVRPFRQF